MQAAKKIIRKDFIRLRNQIDIATRKKAGDSAAKILIDSEVFKKSEHIACYFPMAGEFDSLPILQAVCQHQKKCYLPVLSDEHDLVFALYHPNDPTYPNKYGIPEPDHSLFFPMDHLNLIIVPLVAVDNKGNRLGMGAGYYDRTLSNKKCCVLGLGFEAQRYHNILPADAWDVKLDGLLTENELIFFNSLESRSNI